MGVPLIKRCLNVCYQVTLRCPCVIAQSFLQTRLFVMAGRRNIEDVKRPHSIVKAWDQVILKPSFHKAQVPDNNILTQNLHYNYYYPTPKYLKLGTWTPPCKG